MACNENDLEELPDKEFKRMITYVQTAQRTHECFLSKQNQRDELNNVVNSRYENTIQ